MSAQNLIPSNDVHEPWPNTLVVQSTPDPFAPTSWENIEKLAAQIAESGCFGIKKPAQAITLMMIAKSDGKTLAQSLKQHHVFEDGKLSQRADYTQGVFEQDGNTIIWHVRLDEMVAATFIRGKADDAPRKRALERFKIKMKLVFEKDPAKRALIINDLAAVAHDGEETIIRTLQDVIDKGIAIGKDGNLKTNWHTSPRQMNTSRCVTEGVRVIAPHLIAGMSSDDELSDVKVAEFQRLSPKERMESELAELLEKSRLTGSATERSRLLGLASDLRVKIIEQFGPSEPNLAQSTQPGPESDPLGSPQMADAAPQRPASASEAIPATVDATNATVEPPAAPEWQSYVIQHVKSKTYKGRTLEDLSSAEIEILHEKRSKPYINSVEKELRHEAKMIKRAYDAAFPK